MTPCYTILGTKGLSYAGCYTLAPGISTPFDVIKLGWTNKWEQKDSNVQFCVNHCAHKQLKYAGVVKVSPYQYVLT